MRLGPSKRHAGDFPGGPVVKHPPGKVRDAGPVPCWGTKVPRAMEKPSLFTTTTEAHALWSRCAPTRVCVPHSKIPHEAMKILCAAAKTQCSPNKFKKKRERERPSLECGKFRTQYQEKSIKNKGGKSSPSFVEQTMLRTLCLSWTLHFDEGNGIAAYLDRRSSRSSGTCYYDAERSRKVLLANLLRVRDGCESYFPMCEGLPCGSRDRFILGVRNDVWKLEVA